MTSRFDGLRQVSRTGRTLPVIVLGILLATRPVGAKGDELPIYVGEAVCLGCHAANGKADPCTLRPIPEHAEAYQALLAPKARDIAAISGIFDPPTESRICLDCHATAADEGRRWTAATFRLENGVQCEACHGPGSLHVIAAQTHAAGLPPREPHGNIMDGAPDRMENTEIRRGDRWRCAACHVEMPSHREVLEFGFALSEADRRYKTPVNLAVSPDGSRLYVVCEHSNSLLVVDPAAGTIIHEIAVGRRPHDVALTPDGSMVYVTNRMSDSLSVIDAHAATVVRQIGVGRDPHGVLPAPGGAHVLVLNAGDNSISVIDAGTLAELRRLPAGRGPWSLAVDPDSGRCAVTNVRPHLARFLDPFESEITILDAAGGFVAHRAHVADANMLQGIALVPRRGIALFTLSRTKNLIPMTRLAQGWTITNGLGVLWPDGKVDQLLLDEPNDYFADPMDVAVSPDGKAAVVSSGGRNEIVVLDVDKLLETIDSFDDSARQTVLPNHLGMTPRFVVKRLAVGANPRGVTYSPDGSAAYVANALDDTISVVDTRDYRVARTLSLGGPQEITEIRRGERVFHSAAIAFGRQFSCRSCHPDGHINGLSFDIEADGIGRHPVDNRTLRGILDTPPFKWEGTNPSLHRQCGPRLAVFFTRLSPYSLDDLNALVRYECTIEQSPNPYRLPDGLTVSQRRGKQIFERTTTNQGIPLSQDQQCAHCHAGAYKTNRLIVDVASSMWFDADVAIEPDDLFDTDAYGELGTYYFIDAGLPTKVLDVSHLRNIYESAPYMHNGAAETLEEIWTRFNMVERHGVTADLSRQQFNDLIAYLKSL